MKSLTAVLAGATILVYAFALVGYVAYKVWCWVLLRVRNMTKKPWVIYRRLSESLRWPETHLPRAISDQHRLIDDLAATRFNARVLGWGSLAFPLVAVIIIPAMVEYKPPESDSPGIGYIGPWFVGILMSWAISCAISVVLLAIAGRYSSSDLAHLASASRRLIEHLKEFRGDSPRNAHTSVALRGESFYAAARRAGLGASDPRLVRIQRAYMDGHRGKSEKDAVITDIQDILVSAFQGEFEHSRMSGRSPLGFLASETHLKFVLGCLGLIAATVTLFAAALRLFAQ